MIEAQLVMMLELIEARVEATERQAVRGQYKRIGR
jgi:hypothetical protein